MLSYQCNSKEYILWIEACCLSCVEDLSCFICLVLFSYSGRKHIGLIIDSLCIFNFLRVAQMFRDFLFFIFYSFICIRHPSAIREVYSFLGVGMSPLAITRFQTPNKK